MWKESEKTVYTFQDEMLDEHTGSFGGGTFFVLPVPFRRAFSPAKHQCEYQDRDGGHAHGLKQDHGKGLTASATGGDG
jgi:hypothetical protein